MSESKPKVYFAASIRGGREDQIIYEQIVNELKNHSIVLTEHFADKNLTQMGTEDKTDEKIHDQDLAWINESSIVIAEVTQPSLGVGYELAKAEDLNKRILCLYRESVGKALSAMILGSNKINVKTYKDINDVKEIFADFFH